MAEVKIGIYCIENLINQKKYFGQSVDIYKRLKKHQYLLDCNKHINQHLQSAYNTYSKQNFKFDIVEECDIDELDIRERYYISLYNTTDRCYGYNIESGGSKNKALSIETKLKLRNANIGKKMSAEAKRKISEANKGRKMPESQREKLRIYQTGRHHSEETKKKIALARKKWISEETRKKMSESSKRESLSESTLKKMSESHAGFHHSDETKKRLSLVFKDRQFTDEWRQKISESKKLPVYCPQLDEIFASAKDAEIKYKNYGVSRNKISACLHGDRKSSGKHPNTKEPLTWEKIERII